MRSLPISSKVCMLCINKNLKAFWYYKPFYNCKVSNAKLEKVFKGRFLLHTRAGSKAPVRKRTHQQLPPRGWVPHPLPAVLATTIFHPRGVQRSNANTVRDESTRETALSSVGLHSTQEDNETNDTTWQSHRH